MRIAVNTRFLIPGRMEGIGTHSDAILSRMTRMYPEDAFHFYFDRKPDARFLYSQNVTSHVLSPQARHPLLFIYWFEWVLHRTLKRHRPDVFYSPGSFMPLHPPVPTVITVHDVAHRRFPGQIPRVVRWYYGYYMPKFIAQAEHILTVSEFSKEEICHYYQVPPEKITVIYNGVSDAYHPVSPDEQTGCREKLTQGKPFFLSLGAIHPRKNVDLLIHAFDALKSQQKLPHHLLIAGRMSWQTKQVQEAYHAAKHRKDIRFLGYVPQNALYLLLGSATALVYLSAYEGFGLPVVEAMASGTPVICSDGSALAEVGSTAALRVPYHDREAIVSAMSGLVNDQALRTQCIEKGLKRKEIFDWNTAAEKTHRMLGRVAGR